MRQAVSILHRQMGLLNREPMERLTISLPSEQRAEVGRVAAEHSASEASVIRAALDLGLPELQRKLAAEQAAGPRFDYTGNPGPLRLARPMLERYANEADPTADEADAEVGKVKA